MRPSRAGSQFISVQARGPRMAGAGKARGKRKGAAPSAGRQAFPTASAFAAMLGMITPGAAGRFLAAELRSNPGAAGRLAGLVRRESAKRAKKDYRALTGRALKRAAGRMGYIDRGSRVDFSGPTADARACEGIRDYPEAARIYGEVYEAIDENFGLVYSGVGRFHAQARRCIEGMHRCAVSARTAGERRDVLSRLLRLWLGKGDYCQSDIEKALMSGIAGPGDTGHLAGMLGGGGGGRRVTTKRDLMRLMKEACRKAGR